MIGKTIEESINEQINEELYSAYVYLSMAAYCEAVNFPGFGHWMRFQSREEVGHAMRLFDYLADRGGRVRLKAIEQPPVDFKSPLDMFEQSLHHEEKVSGMINRLYGLAIKESDHATQVALQWFVQEQVEEERSASQIVQRLRMIGDDSASLLILDRELAARQTEA